jgi:hypothetical protein
MRTREMMAFGLVLLGASVVFSQAPVAMRVEVEPQGEADLGARVEVVIQVSPEDRRRVGEHAMVRIELDGEVPRGQSPLWAVSFDADGSAVIDTVWPAGEHRLVVTLESPGRQQTGLWVGTVRVPSYSGTAIESSPSPLPSPTRTAFMPTPTPTPSIVSTTPTPTLVAATATPTATPPAPSPTATLPPPAPVTPTAVPAVPPPSEEAAPVEAPREGSSQDSEPATEDAADSTAATAAAAAVAGAAAAPSAVEPLELEPEVSEMPPESAAAESFAESGEAVDSPPTFSEPEPAAAPEADVAPPAPAGSEPVVEPLRAERSADDAAAAARAEPAASPPVVDQISLARWGQADPDTRDLTVRMSRQGKPVVGLSAGQIQVEFSSSQVPVVAVGDADSAPLLMGFAFDLSPQSAVDWQRISRGLDPLMERARDGRGRAFVATVGEVGGWNEQPTTFEDEVDEVAGGDLAGLISDSLRQFEGLRGRSVLLVVTDGRSQPSKDEWRRVAASVETAGVPVLVASLWDDRFSQRLRKQLSEVAASSGGRSFLVQGADQFVSVVERFGPLIDTTVALRIEVVSLTGDRAFNLSVSTTDPTVEVAAPKSIR